MRRAGPEKGGARAGVAATELLWWLELLSKAG